MNQSAANCATFSSVPGFDVNESFGGGRHNGITLPSGCTFPLQRALETRVRPVHRRNYEPRDEVIDGSLDRYADFTREET